MSPCGPRLNVPPSDWMTVASCPTSTSVWNPALNFAGSYGLSSTTASALSMKRFWRRSYSRPTMAVPPALWPEYEYDPAAYPVSLKPASAVSRWFTGGGGGSGCLAAVSAGGDAPLWAASPVGATSALSRAASAKRLPYARMELSSMSVLRVGFSDELHQTASGSGWSCPILPPEAVSLRITAEPISCVSG